MSSLVCDGKKPPFQKTAAITVMKSLDIVQDSGQLADIKPCSVALTLNGWNTTKRLEITMAMHWSWKLPNMDRSCSSTKTLPVEIGRNNESQSSTGALGFTCKEYPPHTPKIYNSPTVMLHFNGIFNSYLSCCGFNRETRLQMWDLLSVCWKASSGLGDAMNPLGLEKLCICTLACTMKSWQITRALQNKVSN